MNEVYRGHDIVMLESEPPCAIIIERDTGAALPTKITALPDEEPRSCLYRARRLVDLYLEAPSRQ